ncbi:lysine-rich arabinogalactan protein 19 [Drosophila teissieri]|uniref:lysine-rich arabinogalactan protein 19 n=1 Tax=Drosophila teissieri TaxID=7243 RepID=UPI001CBA0DAE|nr:lysine-rich arabinogalactan protein 19 [Drosophila teissieri]
MSLKYLLIASAVLIGLCGADVSKVKAGKVDVPFNDLLPPLNDEPSTTTTTTTQKPTTTLATKPTKKAYYQKPAQLAKEDKPKTSAIKQDVPQLPLDLLPPFEDEVKPAEDKLQPVVNTTPKPVARISQPAVLKVTPSAVLKVTPPAALKVTSPAVLKVTPPAVPKVTPPPAPRPQYSVQPAPASRPQYSVHPAPQAVNPQPTRAPGFGSGFQSRFSNYFLTTTIRPRRGPLPTITPFPRFVRL